MPTYQYQCTNCSYEFEKFQKITDEPIKSCPQCEGRVKRLITGGSGLLFKGSGFYITDYRSPKYNSDKKQAESDAKFAATEKKVSKPENKKSA